MEDKKDKGQFLEPWSWEGRDPGDLFWGYSDTERAWYGQSLGERAGCVNVGIYGTDGGTIGEFSCYWEKLSGERVFKMEVFADAFKALGQAPGLMASMFAGGERWDDKAEFIEFLDQSGFLDLTNVDQRVDPMPGAIEKRAAKMLSSSLSKTLPAGKKGLGPKSI